MSFKKNPGSQYTATEVTELSNGQTVNPGDIVLVLGDGSEACIPAKSGSVTIPEPPTTVIANPDGPIEIMSEGPDVCFNLIANDNNPDGTGGLKVTEIDGQPIVSGQTTVTQLGTFKLQSDGETICLTPAELPLGTAEVPYVLCDADGDITESTITFEIVPTTQNESVFFLFGDEEESNAGPLISEEEFIGIPTSATDDTPTAFVGTPPDGFAVPEGVPVFPDFEAFIEGTDKTIINPDTLAYTSSDGSVGNTPVCVPTISCGHISEPELFNDSGSTQFFLNNDGLTAANSQTNSTPSGNAGTNTETRRYQSGDTAVDLFEMVTEVSNQSGAGAYANDVTTLNPRGGHYVRNSTLDITVNPPQEIETLTLENADCTSELVEWGIIVFDVDNEGTVLNIIGHTDTAQIRSSNQLVPETSPGVFEGEQIPDQGVKFLGGSDPMVLELQTAFGDSVNIYYYVVAKRPVEIFDVCGVKAYYEHDGSAVPESDVSDVVEVEV